MPKPFSDSSIRIEKSAIGSAIVSGDGNTIYVIHQAPEQQDEKPLVSPSNSHIGPNPYKGLAAFVESDADYYFGRDEQIQRLWKRFQNLYEQSNTPRFLPILGPSGCGKSSLARAGLIPELARKPLLGKTQMRVIVMLPGESPLKALAGVLAKLTQDDQTPEVIKKRRYAEELRDSAKSGQFDFLQDVAETLSDIKAAPLVVMVDQFEEVYSLCKDADEREIFINTLLQAASSTTGYVSVVITLRSDFLGETQYHQQFNQVIGSDQSTIVPAMTEEELRQAITEPAAKNRHPLDAATVNLLIEETKNYEGALPLLQFTLQQIWEGLLIGTPPTVTLKNLGGVGGSLAGRAQEIYSQLSSQEQEIAKYVFVGLAQLGEGIKDTRRRCLVKNLILQKTKPEDFYKVLQRFSAPDVRMITLSVDYTDEFSETQLSNRILSADNTAEITHEALLEHWNKLKNWLNENRKDIRLLRRVETAATLWEQGSRHQGRLWRSIDLATLRSYTERSKLGLTTLQTEFLYASIWAERRQKGGLLLGLVSIFALLAGSLWQQAQSRKTIEAIFLGADTTEILAALPSLKQSADRYSQKIDRLSELPDDQQAISFYQENKLELHQAMAYYRNILEVVSQLEQDRNLEELISREELQNDFFEPAEKSLAHLIIKYRIPQLRMQLSQDPPAFGKFLEKDRLEFEDQYTEGALRTTYEILMRNSGAGADLNNDGFILSTQEASQMPCLVLQKIEELWREVTNLQCGWYSSDEYPRDSHGCKEVDSQNRSLYAAIFGYDQEFDLERIQGCSISPS